MTLSLSDAVSLHQAGRIAEAAAVYRDVLRQAPETADARHLLGLAVGAGGDPKGAATLIREAVALQPDLTPGFINLGRQLGLAGLPEAAVAAYRRALALDPGQTMTRNALWTAFHQAVATCWREMPVDQGDVVIYQHNAGLGDNLLYSTLPERFAARGQRVYVSDMNRTRNSEIHDLVWGMNPYVAGVSERPAAAGMAKMVGGVFEAHSHILNWLTRIEVLHGLEPVNDLPRIYYAPKPHPALAGRVLVDVNSSTIKYPPDEMRQYVAAVMSRFHYRPDELTQLVFRRPDVSQSNGALPGVATHEITNIFELCDALFSARAFITVHSGANTLAAAIKQNAAAPAIHCAVDANHFNQKCYIWRNIDYMIVRSLPDGGA